MYPAMNNWAIDPIWIVSLLSFLGFVAWAWSGASYDMYKELESSAEKRSSDSEVERLQLRERITQIEQQLDHRGRRHAIRGCFSKILSEASDLYNVNLRERHTTVEDRDAWIVRCEQWFFAACETVARETSESDLHTFTSLSRRHADAVERQQRYKSGKDLEWFIRLAEYIDNLRDLIRSYSP
jgi:hypothetical protein